MMRTSGWKHRPLPGDNNHNSRNNDNNDDDLRLNEMYGRALYRSAYGGSLFVVSRAPGSVSFVTPHAAVDADVVGKR